MPQNFIASVKNIQNLRKAWGVVRSNAISSLSNSIRQQALEYDTEIDKHLGRIQRQIRESRFKFQPGFGVAKEVKPGKKRPIVIPPIDNRIVQRAILQVLQSVPTLKSLIETPTSCGGIAKRGVKYAVEKAYGKMQLDGKYYIRSDIMAFFTKISKEKVLQEIKLHIDERPFLELLEQAMEVVLSNSFELGDDLKLFPINDLGVAQGSCLSPLMGNIILSEFDRELNSDDVLCLRYIDDFIIIGPSHKAVNAKLKKGLKILKQLGLDAYSPSTNPDKAAQGETSRGFEFLGCDVRPGLITPIKASRKRLVQKIGNKINLSKIAMKATGFPSPLRENSFVGTMLVIHATVKAWGNQYQFCNNSLVMEQLDTEISSKIESYEKFYASVSRGFDEKEVAQKRRLLGVHALIDSKKNPIISSVRVRK